MKQSTFDADILIIGAGAAGLTAGIWAARSNPRRKIVLLDGAKTLGAKILVAGGGRCNVTHDEVDESAYAGGSRNAIKKVLRRFDVPQTVAWFHELGVELKREETGKLFPTTDSAKTVLSALINEIRRLNVSILYPRRVETIERNGDGFIVSGEWGTQTAAKVVLATGGKSLPKSGSDGHGYELARALGHQITRRVFPALVPLTLPRDHFICTLSGLTLPTTLDLHSGTGKKLVSFTNSTLCTHFGLSGPSVLDISRYYIEAKLEDQAAYLTINWLVDAHIDQVDAALSKAGKVTLQKHFAGQLPERLFRALCAESAVDPATLAERLTREQRRNLARALTELSLPITGNRGYTYAEVTAGGVPLTDIRLETMESRICPNLYFCGEICDVDGRIGGYNFQWAWASGFVVGNAV
jgi:predicted Rossmann fold flavoprotein